MDRYALDDWKSGVRPPKGWDCANACDDGWTKADLDAFMRATVKPWTPPKNDRPAEKPEEEPMY